MKIGIIGRTKYLLMTAHKLSSLGYKIGFIWTCKSEEFYKTTSKDFKELAEHLNVPFINTLNIKDGLKLIEPVKVDLCVSVNFTKIIPDYFRSKFRFGVLNAHAGDLPRYKGNACPNWAILNGEKKIGLTIHEMADELDSGDIYHKTFFPLKKDTYITDVYNWFDGIIPESFIIAIKKIEKGVRPEKQSKIVKSLRTYPRKPEDSRINWGNSSKNILRLVRASSRPFNGAFCYVNNNENEKLVVFRAEVMNIDFDYLAVPGQICFTENSSIVVSSKDKMIKLTDYSLNGENINKSKSLIVKSLRNRLT